MNESRQRYRLDDYLQDKAARSSSPLSTKASPLTRKETYSSSGWARPAPVVNAPSEVIVRPPHTVPKPTSGTVDVEKPDTGAGTGGGVLTQSQMTTAYTKQLMENALSNLLAMQNRKFKYDAHSSPLYSIVQKQAEENARLASGRAYAQAKGATGGYGSSYATLAADEAGRQAMRELDDQQLALYEAARAEFEAENASALDWYNTTKQLHEDAYVLEQDAKANAPTTMTLEDGTTVEVTDAARELYAGYLDSFTQGTGYDTLKTAMINGGASEADADQAIAMFKKLGSATISDQISALGTNPTLSGAAEIMAQAKVNGTDAEVLPKISEQMMTAFGSALEDPSEAYTLLGVSAEDWNSMFSGYTDPDERASAEKAYVLEAAGEARKQGLMSGEAYVDMLNIDVVSSIKDIMKNEADKPASAVADVVISLQNYKDAGYLSEREYNSALDVINSRVDMNELWKTQTQGWGVKETKKAAEYVLKHMSYIGYELSASEKRSLMKAIEESASALDVVMSVANMVPGLGSNIVGQIFGAIEATGKVTGANKPLSMTGDQFEAITELEKRKKK